MFNGVDDEMSGNKGEKGFVCQTLPQAKNNTFTRK